MLVERLVARRYTCQQKFKLSVQQYLGLIIAVSKALRKTCGLLTKNRTIPFHLSIIPIILALPDCNKYNSLTLLLI